MKSSKYTQVTSPLDNDFLTNDYQNIEVMTTIISSDERNSNISSPQGVNPEYENAPSYLSTKNNANQHFGCRCVTSPPFPSRFSEQNLTLNRSFASIPKMEALSSSRFSLDRKMTRASRTHAHDYRKCVRKDMQMQRNVRSPEIIDIHRLPRDTIVYDDCEDGDSMRDHVGFNAGLNCEQRSCGLRRERSLRSSFRCSKQRRAAGDGRDAAVEDPETMFVMADHHHHHHHHLGDCQYSCDHNFLPGYTTTCLQEERTFLPAPDVTRRLQATPVVGTPARKPDLNGSPPYLRAASAASSASNSVSAKIELSTRHWWIILMILLLAAAAGVGVPIALKISSSAPYDERLEFATRLLQEVPLVDGHNDLPWNIRKFLHNKLKNFKFDEDLKAVSPWSTSAWSHTDLVRLEQGRVAAQFWAAYVPCNSQHKDAVQLTLEQIDVIRRFTELYHPRLSLCTSAEDIFAAHRKQHLCSLIGVEGGHSLAGSLGVLRTLYHVGVRYLTLTSTCNTPWADCSYADMPGKKAEHGGLTAFGKTIIKEMNRIGMIVDLSHVSVRTMRDALEVSKAPVIFSHSSAQSICNSTRNVPDETLRRLALNRGVVMVNFYTQFLTCKNTATIADAVAHINHIREVAGVDYVGLGAGYDGINYVPQGLEDVSTYPNLFAELIGTGKWNVEDLKKLAGLNFLRVFREVEKVRDEFKKANVPPYEEVQTPRTKDNNCSSQDHF